MLIFSCIPVKRVIKMISNGSHKIAHDILFHDGVAVGVGDRPFARVLAVLKADAEKGGRCMQPMQPARNDIRCGF